MLYAMSIIVSIILVLCLALLFVGLPGIWASIAIAGVWAFCVDAQAMLSFSFFIPIILMATMAEVAEFCISYYGTKKFGGSSKGGFAGIIGGFIGAIFGAAFLFGFGAVLGAFGGGFIGCFLYEKIINKTTGSTAINAAWGTTLGRLGGLIVKLGLGIWILTILVPAVIASAG